MYQPEDRLFCVFAEYKPLEADPLDGLLVSSRLDEGMEFLCLFSKRQLPSGFGKGQRSVC